MHFFATYGQISDYLKHFSGKYGGNMLKLAKLAKFQNFKKIDFVPKNPKKNFWKKIIFYFWKKCIVSRKISKIQPISIIFGQNMGPNGQKWPKSGKKSKKLKKIRGGQKKISDNIFLTFLEKYIFSRKISQIQPISRISSIFWEKI